MKITKTRYLHGFAILTVFLALVRCMTAQSGAPNPDTSHALGKEDAITSDSSNVSDNTSDGSYNDVPQPRNVSATPFARMGEGVGKEAVPHRIWSVPSYKEAFPDSNNVQLVAAQKYGVKPVSNRIDAEKRKNELVYAASNPYFHVDRLRESIPYLVPRANVLLQDIGRAFYDSLYIKGVPLHQIIVTSVLRSEEDIVKLRKHNGNASENSCHRFGTTFDICYNRYVTVQTKAEPRRVVSNDSLKWVLSEVLRDMRQSGRCYVKYEVKQGCFHITVR